MSDETATSNVTQGDVMYGEAETSEESTTTEESQEEKEQGSESQEDSNEVETEKEESKEKGEEEASNEDSKEDEGKEAESKEEIKYDLKLSEKSFLAEENVKEVESFAKENGLSNEAANKLLNYQEDLISNFADKIQDRHEQQVDDWFNECQKDPEIGGDKLGETSELSKRALKAFGSDELSQALKETGYGNNPHVVRFLRNIGEVIQDDKLVLGGAEGKQTSKAERLYGND